MGILSFLLGLINPIERITDRIAQAVVARENARTDQDRIAADERVKMLEARRDVQIAESHGWVTTSIRAAFALPFVFYLWKLVVWDKVAGLGATDSLSPDLWNVFSLVLAFFFLDTVAQRFRR